MNVRLVKNIPKEELLASRTLLKNVVTLLEEDYQSSLNSMYSITSTGSEVLPRLVESVTEQKTLRKIINLLTIKVETNEH